MLLLVVFDQVLQKYMRSENNWPLSEHLDLYVWKKKLLHRKMIEEEKSYEDSCSCPEAVMKTGMMRADGGPLVGFLRYARNVQRLRFVA